MIFSIFLRMNSLRRNFGNVPKYNFIATLKTPLLENNQNKTEFKETIKNKETRK